jgi:hypothetical protein
MSRVEALLRSMTWDEKLAQMQVVFKANPARFVVEPGAFGLYIGGSLRATRELTFEVR